MIRKYTSDDLAELLGVWYDASQIAHSFLTHEFFEQERKNISDKYLPNAETWVCEDDARVVGFIAMLDNEVGAIFVSPKSQGRGIGRALMDHARAGRDDLLVDVFKANEIGRAFYDAYGFEIIGELVHEETGQPLLRMRWKMLSSRNRMVPEAPLRSVE